MISLLFKFQGRNLSNFFVDILSKWWHQQDILKLTNLSRGRFLQIVLSSKNTYKLEYWAAKQQTSWVIAPWWFSVSPWRICITFVWPRSSLKLSAPSRRLDRNLHFALIRLCLPLLFIISILKKWASKIRRLCEWSLIESVIVVGRRKPLEGTDQRF